jgi:hypothetical protein
MRCNPRLAITLLVLSSCGLAVRPAAGAAPAAAKQARAPELPTTKLVELAQSAHSQFRPLAADHVARAKAQLTTAIEHLDQALNRTSPENARQWKDYLQWDEMIAALAQSPQPDLRKLGPVAAKYFGDYGSLELPVFSQVRDSLVAYLTAIERASDAHLQESYQKRLATLIDMLPEYEARPTLELRQQIGQTLAWLETTAQAPALVAAVRRKNWKPNLYAELSERLVSLGVGDAVTEESDVADCILGTALFGRASMQGRTSVRLIDDVERANLEVVLTGTVTSSNVGYNRGVQIFSRGTTGVEAAVPVYLDPIGFSTGGAQAYCSTNSQIDDIVAKRCLVERIAWKKANRSKAEAEAIGSEHAEARIAERMDQRTAELLREMRESYDAKFRRPLLRRGEFPQDMKFRTQQGFLNVVWRQANPSQLAAPTVPPQIPGKHDVAVRLHESMVSNLSRAMIGGKKLTDKKLVEILQKNKLAVPEAVQPSSDKEPWSITFASNDPASAVFDGNTIRFAVRGQRFESGENTVSKLMEMSAVYAVQKTPDGARLVRQGDVSVDYIDKQPGQRRNVEIVVRAVMRQKFEALFAPVIETTGISLPGRLQDAGKLRLDFLAAHHGWLSLAWQQVGGQPVAEETAASSECGVAPSR